MQYAGKLFPIPNIRRICGDVGDKKRLLLGYTGYPHRTISQHKKVDIVDMILDEAPLLCYTEPIDRF